MQPTTCRSEGTGSRSPPPAISALVPARQPGWASVPGKYTLNEVLKTGTGPWSTGILDLVVTLVPDVQSGGGCVNINTGLSRRSAVTLGPVVLAGITALAGCGPTPAPAAVPGTVTQTVVSPSVSTTTAVAVVTEQVMVTQTEIATTTVSRLPGRDASLVGFEQQACQRWTSTLGSGRLAGMGELPWPEVKAAISRWRDVNFGPAGSKFGTAAFETMDLSIDTLLKQEAEPTRGQIQLLAVQAWLLDTAYADLAKG